MHSSTSTSTRNIDDRDIRDSLSPSLPIEASNDEETSSFIVTNEVGLVLGSLENLPETVAVSYDKGAGSSSSDKGSSTGCVCISENDVLHFKKGLKEYPRGPSSQNASKNK